MKRLIVFAALISLLSLGTGCNSIRSLRQDCQSRLNLRSRAPRLSMPWNRTPCNACQSNPPLSDCPSCNAALPTPTGAPGTGESDVIYPGGMISEPVISSPIISEPYISGSYVSPPSTSGRVISERIVSGPTVTGSSVSRSSTLRPYSDAGLGESIFTGLGPEAAPIP
jgi:hypothetical protein